MVWDKWFYRWAAHGSQEGPWAYCDGLTGRGEKNVKICPAAAERLEHVRFPVFLLEFIQVLHFKGLWECHDFNDMSKVSVKRYGISQRWIWPHIHHLSIHLEGNSSDVTLRST